MSDSPADGVLRRGDRRVVRCEGMVHGGLCLAHSDERTLFVSGAIPGELVEVSLTFSKGRSWFCRVERVVEASPDRLVPPCPYVPDCGGCQLQHIAPERQLLLKRDVVLDALRRERVAVPTLRLHGMPDPWHYRWRGEFHVVRGRGGTEAAGLGFNRARSWHPIAVESCLIHHRSITDRLPQLRELVRGGGSEAMTVLHVTAGEDGDELLLRAKPEAALDRAVIDRLVAELPAPERWSTNLTTLHWRGRSFRVSPDSFIQVSWDHLDTLYGCVLNALGDIGGQRIIDGYAGIGVLAVVMAARARQVVCIESNPGAVRMGRLNARINDVGDRLSYVAQPVETALPRVAASAPVDRLVIDPPRAGCGGQVTGWLALAGPPRVVYISCDPATLARDLHVLVTTGPYAIDSFDLVDMFPQTSHVESVVALRRES